MTAWPFKRQRDATPGVEPSTRPENVQKQDEAGQPPTEDQKRQAKELYEKGLADILPQRRELEALEQIISIASERRVSGINPDIWQAIMTGASGAALDIRSAIASFEAQLEEIRRYAEGPNR
jgi:hypothetical protein